jgi:predicted transcriptional regulator
MKSVLIRIQPKWCELIASGKKAVEVRKTKPKLETPFKVYIYCTHSKNGTAYCKGNDILNGKVIGEFVCDEIECFTTDYRADKEQTERISKQSCVSWLGMAEYEINSHCLYGWHISDLVIYDKPRELGEFGLKRPPQSWLYCESESDTD